MYRAKVLLETVVKSSKWQLSAQAKIKKNVWSNSAKYYSTSASAERFPTGHSSQYIEDMYNAWLENPTSVHSVSFFAIKNHKILAKVPSYYCNNMTLFTVLGLVFSKHLARRNGISVITSFSPQK